jgi:hypothetical protein
MTAELIQLTNQPKPVVVVMVISVVPMAVSGTSVTRGASTTHPEKHGKSRTSGPLDPLRETACSNPLRSNRGTIRIHCRTCRTAQTRWLSAGSDISRNPTE